MELTAELKKFILSIVQKLMKSYVPIRYMNQKQACVYANTSPKTMNQWVEKGLLKQVVFDDESNPKYDAKDIDEFMERHKIGGKRL